MAITSGDVDATTGMAKAIYDQVSAVLSPDVPASALSDAQASWKKLSFAIASGVTDALRRGGADPDFAEVTSSASDDPAYWSWLTGFVGTFTSWNPAAADGIALKNALTTFLAGKPVPTELKGSVR